MAINIKLDDLIYPYFVVDGSGIKEEIESFPGQFRFSIDRLIEDIGESVKLGIGRILLFGIPDRKDVLGAEAYKNGNLIAETVRKIKNRFPDLVVITDVCLCSYTTHGHCGIISDHRLKTIDHRPNIDTKKTVEVLAKIALTHAAAGADWVAPSAMAKGQVLAIRKALDACGYKDMKIMGYSAKFASNFYGPFRNAAASAPKFGDRRAYQLDCSNGKAALKEIADDIKEGADVVMVKPALSYLDVIKEARLRFSHPLAAYNVSGEYAMLKAYIKTIDHRPETRDREKNLVFEILTSIKRAGADTIITYHAKDVAGWLKE